MTIITRITHNRIFLTLKYMLCDIHGYTTIPINSFPYRMGCHNSDMFRIVIDNNKEYFLDGISLSEYHAAFLCSPIFQMELWILSKFGILGDTSTIDPITTTIQHLQGVATGDHSSFGPWTTWAVEGNRIRPIVATTTIPGSTAATGSNGSTTNNNNSSSSSSEPSSTKEPCVIMRCRTRHGPFCDTWWALPLEEESTTTDPLLQQQTRRPQLVFGTSLLNEYHNSFFARLMKPLHRFYSRLLLANCKATLVYKYQKQHQQ